MEQNTTDKENQPSSAVAVERSGSADATRRRLIMASAAAPLVATLTPNSALAMSSAVDCAMRPGKYESEVAEDTSDGAMRRRVKKYTKKLDESGPPVLYEIDDKRYKPDGTRYTRRWNTRRQNKYNHQYVDVLQLYQVDESGITGEGTWPKVQRTGTTPLSVSCWASINPDLAGGHNV